MAVVYLIRHGKTAGNLERRYVGRTDEALCEEGIREIYARRDALLRAIAAEIAPGADVGRSAQADIRAVSGTGLPKTVYVSPMLRCRQTAELFFVHAAQEIENDFREMDFGEFEYKNYEELAGDVRYQAFIDSGGVKDFPGAEPQRQFRQRVRDAFARRIGSIEASAANFKTDLPREPLVFVVHGGTIMAILEAYAYPERGYFEWQTAPACGYRCEAVRMEDGLRLEKVTRIDKL